MKGTLRVRARDAERRVGDHRMRGGQWGLFRAGGDFLAHERLGARSLATRMCPAGSVQRLLSAGGEAPMPSRIEESLRLVRAEYREMPGLNLTTRQAERLWSLDKSTCEEVFRTLEAEHVLQRTPRDGFVLARAGY